MSECNFLWCFKKEIGVMLIEFVQYVWFEWVCYMLIYMMLLVDKVVWCIGFGSGEWFVKLFWQWLLMLLIEFCVVEWEKIFVQGVVLFVLDEG